MNAMDIQVSDKPQIAPPLWLLAEVTYRCPLHCVFCYNPLNYAGNKNELTTEQWKDVFTQARKLGAAQLGDLRREGLDLAVGVDLEQHHVPAGLALQHGIAAGEVAPLRLAEADQPRAQSRKGWPRRHQAFARAFQRDHREVGIGTGEVKNNGLDSTGRHALDDVKMGRHACNLSEHGLRTNQQAACPAKTTGFF